MILNDLANFGEFTAGVATVITLIFVLLELRANRRQNRLAMLTALDRGWNDINAQIAQDAALGNILAQGCYAPETLSDDDATRFFFLAAQYLNHHKSVWTLLTRDGLDTHHERWLKADLAAMWNVPGFHKVLMSMESWNPPEFTAFARTQGARRLALPDWRAVEFTGAMTPASFRAS